MIQTDGIVLREQAINENDKLLTLLTRTLGVVRVFANGTRVPKHRNAAACSLLCYADFSLDRSKKGTFTVREATVKKIFFELQNDIMDLALAQYFAELTAELSPREEDSDVYLRLILNALALLAGKKKSRELLKPTVELRLLSLSGYMPALAVCGGCGEALEGEVRYCPGSGLLFCSRCTPTEKFLPLPAGALDAMRHICLSPDEKVFSFRLPPRTLQTLGDASERSVRNVITKRLMTLEFYQVLTM